MCTDYLQSYGVIDWKQVPLTGKAKDTADVDNFQRVIMYDTFKTKLYTALVPTQDLVARAIKDQRNRSGYVK